MKKLSLMTIVILMGLSFIFVSLCGANETIIPVEKGDTIHGYIVKYFPDVKPSAKAYKALAEHNDISNPDHIVIGKEFLIPSKLFIEKTTVDSKSVDKKPVGKAFESFENNLFKVKVIEKHVLKKDETISYLVMLYYANKRPTPKTCEALARFNGIKDKDHVREGQVVNIPNVLILEQSKVGANPTTVSREKAIELAIGQINTSAKEAGIKVYIDKSKSKGISEKIAKSDKKLILNGKLAAAATFGTGVQGWTKVTAKDELSGKSTSLRNGKYSVKVAVADQCDNAYIVIDKRLAILPPLPTEEIMPDYSLPLPDGKIRTIKSGSKLKEVCESCFELNNVNGAFYDVPVTGGKVHGWWTSTEWWFDCNGNWTNGIGLLTRNWWGQSGDATPYKFEGNVLLPAIMTRYTDEDWQIVARYAAGEREDEGGFENEYVKYTSNGTSDIQNYYVSVEKRDESKQWFSKNRLSVEVEKASNQTRSDKMFSKWDGSYIPLDDIKPEDQDTMSATLATDVYRFDEKRNILAITEISGGHQDNYENNSFSLRGGMQFYGGIKVLTGYTWNDSEPVADTKNVWSVEFYPYGLWKGIERERTYIKVIQNSKADSPEKAKERMQEYGEAVIKLK